MDTIGCKILEKNIKNFSCEFCHFICSKKGDFSRHCLTAKHQKRVKMIQKDTKDTKKTSNDVILPNFTSHCESKFQCICGNVYKYHSGLWRHKQNCNKNSSINPYYDNINKNLVQNEHTDKELVMLLIKENSELKNMMMEVIKTGTHNTYNNNSNNKTFNLQVFLNETCKDAMNIMDFVNSIEIDLDDLEKVGELGYVNGMTNIILKNLKALDVTKRPLHCTDVKREIIYIKDDNKWEKENENKDKMKKALKYIIHKNAKMLNVFKAKYPDCIKSYSNRCDQYNKLVVEVLGGKGDNEALNNEKIIRRIAREIAIDKGL